MALEYAWSAPAQLTGSSPGSMTPAVAVVGTTPHVVWAVETTLYHSRLLPEGWTEPVRVATGVTPALLATRDGRLHCIFANVFIGNAEIYHVFWDGKSWSLPNNVSHTSGASSQPAVAVGPDGILHASWTDTTPGRPVIYYGKQDGKFWGSEPVPNGRGSTPSLAVDAQGSVFLAWQDWLTETDCNEIFLAVRQNSQWDIPADLSDTPRVHSIHPRVALAHDGSCHVVWEEERGSTYGVRYRSWNSKSGWSGVADLAGPDGDCRSPQMTVNPQGFVEALWLQDAEIVHRARHPDAGSEWSPASVTGGINALTPDLACAMALDGGLHVVAGTTGRRSAGGLFYLRRQPMFTYNYFMSLVMG